MQRQNHPLDGIDPNDFAKRFQQNRSARSAPRGPHRDTSMARKTRQRSASSAGTVADLELDRRRAAAPPRGHR